MAIYCGSDQLEINYDFFTKTAGQSTGIDCPLELYTAARGIDPANPIKPPQDPTVLGKPATLTLTAVAGGTLPAGTYNFAVCAYNANGDSYLKEASITTVSTGSIKIDWTAPSVGTPTGYKIYSRTTNKVYDAGNVTTYTSIGSMPDNSTVWDKVTSQVVLDKLKSQDQPAVTITTNEGGTYTFDGKTYVKQDANHCAVKDDYAGKTTGDTTGNPNVVRGGYASNSTILLPPTDISKFYEVVEYDQISVIGDNKSYTRTVTGNGQIPQILLSYDLIRIWEDKYGLIPIDRNGTAEEVKARCVAWLKGNLGSIICKPVSYGVCPTGNKVYIQEYNSVSNVWSSPVSNTPSSPSLLTRGESTLAYILVDADGKCHFLVYTDPASTTSDKILVLTGHGLTNGNVIENTTRNRGCGIATNTTNLSVLSCLSTITGQVAGDSIDKYHVGATKTAGVGTTDTVIKITGHGLANTHAHWIYNSTAKVLAKVTVTDVDTLTLVGVGGGASSIATQTSGDSIQLYPYLGTQTAESTVIPSTVYLDYASIELQYKQPSQYDALVPQNPRRDAGLSNILLMEKDGINIITSGYPLTGLAGKTVSNIVTNGNFEGSDYTSDGWIKGGSATFSYDNTTCATGTKSLKGITNGAANVYKPYIPIQNHKYYICAWVKSDGVANPTIRLYVGSGGSGTITTRTDVISTSWIKVSQIGTVTSIGTSPGIIFYPDYNDRSGLTGWCDSYMAVDLTATFGAGNEPTQAQCDIMFANWFDGTVKMLGDISTEVFTGNSVELESLTSGKAPGYLISADFSALVTALSGGSNSAFKSLYKTTSNANLYCMGQGALNGSVGYGVKIKGYTTSWQDLGSNTGTSIATVNAVLNNSAYIQSNNAIYLLVHPTYGSDGVISSSLSLDFMQLQLLLTRQNDVVSLNPLTLQQNYAFIIQGFTPSYTESTAIKNRTLLYIKKDVSNYIELNYDYSTKKFNFIKCVAGTTTTLSSNAQTFNKWQTFSIIIGQTNVGMVLRVLKNAGTVEKYTNTDVTGFTGQCSLYPLTKDVTGNEADGFISRIGKLDLNNYGWSTGIPDEIANGIMNGSYSGFGYPVLTGTVQVCPNNRYSLTGQGDLYINGYKTRAVTSGDITTSGYENKIVLSNGSSLVLKM